jgi:hypothetical protein
MQLRLGKWAITTLSMAMLALASTTVAQETATLNYEAGFYYTIQKGDTLWDISEHFNDSPWMWPELWKENDQISNPHWIYPGERIRLYQRSGEDKLSLQPPPKSQIADRSVAEEASQPLGEKPRQAYFLYSAVNQLGFIRKEPALSFGTIFKVKDDKLMASEGDTIYVKPSKGQPAEFALGSRFTVYRTLKPTKAKDCLDKIGTQHYLTGVIEIVENETGYAIARVIQSFRTIKKGDLLMPYKHRSSQIPLSDTPAGIEGMIIVSEEHSQLLGDNTIAFIDKGDTDNVTVGQRYDIYQQDEAIIDEEQKEPSLLAPVVIGSLIVLRTEPYNATVLITKSNRHIKPGQKIKSPNS